MESESEDYSRFFLTLVRENLETYHKFRALLEKHAPEAANGSIELMFNEVQTLFHSDEYLINKFSNFVEYYRKTKNSPSPVKEETKILMPPVQKEKETKKLMSAVENEVPLCKNHLSVDMLNNVSRSLKAKQFEKFINIVASYKTQKDVERVRDKAYKVLKRHPVLLREWAGFLAEANLGKGSKDKYHDELMFDFERAMHETDLLFHRALCVKYSARKLISENWDKNPMEIIDVGAYFSALDVRCVKKNLKGCRHLLLNKLKSREKAVKVAKRIVCCVEKKIEKLMRLWSAEKKQLALEKHLEESEIPVFNWYTDD